MTTAQAARARYATNTVQTASPAALLNMLMDRLVRDIVTAGTALAEGDLGRASTELVHAQAIVMELNTSLDRTKWDGAEALGDLYTFIHAELVAANLRKDSTRVATCLELVEPLRDAWRAAALQAVRPA
jgi:flagellar protein FliS